MPSEHRHTVRADLVRNIAVGGNSIGSNYYCVNGSSRHQAGGHVVADERCWNARTGKLPRGKARALSHWSGFVCIHPLDLALLRRRIHDAKGGAVAHCRQASRIAVRQHARSPRQQFCSFLANSDV